MMKTIACASLSIVLVACSAPDSDHAEACGTPSASARESHEAAESAPAQAAIAPTPDNPMVDAASPAPEKAEHEKTTFEYCSGYWQCYDFGQNWMRPTGTNACKVGSMIHLYADGTATHDNEAVGAGTWKGDAYELKLMFPALEPNRPVVACSRMPEK